MEVNFPDGLNVVSLTTTQMDSLHEAATMEVSNKTRTENIDNPYEEMAVSFLNVVMEGGARYMKQNMAERYRSIDQLIRKRVVSLYLKEIEGHVSRIEALMLNNERINGDKAPADIMDIARKGTIRMGCCTHLPGETESFRTDVRERNKI